MKTSTYSALLLLATSAFTVPSLSKVYFQENFSSPDWQERWVNSENRKDYGKLAIETGKYFKDAEDSKGLKTTEDARFYALSAPFDEEFDNKDKNFIFQFSVKHEQNIDCGGGYFKVLLKVTTKKGTGLMNLAYIRFCQRMWIQRPSTVKRYCFDVDFKLRMASHLLLNSNIISCLDQTSAVALLKFMPLLTTRAPTTLSRRVRLLKETN
jgi:hypothetical protein